MKPFSANYNKLCGVMHQLNNIEVTEKRF